MQLESLGSDDTNLADTTTQDLSVKHFIFLDALSKLMMFSEALLSICRILSVFDDEKAILEAVKTGIDYDSRNNSTGISTTSLTAQNSPKSGTQPMLADSSLCANSRLAPDTNHLRTDCSSAGKKGALDVAA
jgi:hypothetical protein